MRKYTNGKLVIPVNVLCMNWSVFVEVIYTNIKFRNISTCVYVRVKTRNWIAALRLLNSLCFNYGAFEKTLLRQRTGVIHKDALKKTHIKCLLRGECMGNTIC